ncbi:MAG: hypothetical protein HC812_15440 [Leptolyngbya sp. RL_3_1]|nr:hypothetical protein [Leptolyngbya sp. RL_3_1]
MNQRYERASVQHRDKGGLIQMSLAATDWTATDKEITPVDLEILYADSHRGSGRLTAQATNSTVVLAWRGTGRISPLDATALA